MGRMMRVWFDTEFIDDGRTIDLISIGLVRDDGHYYYAESSECNLASAGDWVKKNVIPHLTGPRFTRAELRSDILTFCGSKPEFWAYYCSYDWVALCQLFGTMMSLPKGWPMYCNDVKQVCYAKGNPRLPLKDGAEHNALADARWTLKAWRFLNGESV